jgi:hypothetical protein
MTENNKLRSNEKGGAQAPSETNKNANVPQNPVQREQPKEGDIRKVDSDVKRSTDRESFDDDYEVRTEEEISRENVKAPDRSKNTRSGKR